MKNIIHFKNKEKTIFFWGNPPYANIVLNQLMNYGINITGLIYTDLKNPEYNKLVNKYNILNYSKLFFSDQKKLIHHLKKTDLSILANFGHFIPKGILKAPRLGFLNIHPSLLPRHRGPAPVAAEIMSGDIAGGVSVMKMDNKIDHGPILGQVKDIIGEEENASDVYIRRFQMGTKLLADLLDDYLNGKIKLQPQNDNKATNHDLLAKEDGYLDPKRIKPQMAYNMIRAYNPWPLVYIKWVNRKGKELKIQLIEAAKVTKSFQTNKAYKDNTFQIIGKSLYLKLLPRNPLIEIKKVRIENKGTICAESFINGYLKN